MHADEHTWRWWQLIWILELTINMTCLEQGGSSSSSSLPGYAYGKTRQQTSETNCTGTRITNCSYVSQAGTWLIILETGRYTSCQIVHSFHKKRPIHRGSVSLEHGLQLWQHPSGRWEGIGLELLRNMECKVVILVISGGLVA